MQENILSAFRNREKNKGISANRDGCDLAHRVSLPLK